MPTKPTIVYILFHETNSGNSASESDGYVEGVYATEQAAEVAMDAAREKALAEGLSVWDGETESPTDWEHDWRVEPHQVLTGGADAN